MLTVIIILQLIAALFLILVVLFQSGKSQRYCRQLYGQVQGQEPGCQAGQGYQVGGRRVHRADPGHQLYAGRRCVTQLHRAPRSIAPGRFLFCPAVRLPRLRRYALDLQQLRHRYEYVALLL